MVKKREINFKRYILAFFLSSFIFLLGLLVGFTLTNYRTSYLEDIAYKQKIDYESLQLQSLYLDISSSNQSCFVFNDILETSLNDVGSAQAKVDLYIKESSSEDYIKIKRDYILAQIRYWLLNKKISELCNLDNVAVLYFYSNKDCPDCGIEGTLLTYLKQNLKDRLLVFSIDSDFKEEPMVNIIKSSYNITKVPSLVIKDKKIEGLITLENLSKTICSLYSLKPDYCSNYINSSSS